MDNIFKEYVIDNELYVDATNWKVLRGKYEQEHIIQQISDAIVEFEIKLPYREILLDDVYREYEATKPVIIFIKFSVGNVMRQDIQVHKRLGRPKDSV